jgi:hypothetical protein
MKFLIPLFLFTALSNNAYSHPGGNLLVCKSAKESGSKEIVEITLRRSNGNGWFAPEIDVKVDNKSFRLTTPKENNNYGITFHNSPLKVITVSAVVPYKSKKMNAGDFMVVAMPNTVKAFDQDNNPVDWTLEAEKDECYDSYGRATFQGIFHGFFFIHDEDIKPETQILDCELTYNPGMSC